MATTASCARRDERELMAHRVGKAAANMRWLSDNMPDLRGRYLHKFVAVHEGRILAVADDQESVFRQLKRMKGLDIGVVAIEFITEEGTTWILW